MWERRVQVFMKVRHNLGLLSGQVYRQGPEEFSISAPLKAGGFADISIVGYINEINAMGYRTVASCSGMRRDHYGREESPYLSIELPEDVVTPGFGRTPHEVFPSQIKNRIYIDSLIRAGELVNWISELSLYMMFIPTVHYELPKTGSIENDRRAESEPSVIQAQRDLEDVMGRGHTSEEFMEKLDKRDRIREIAYQKYGGIKSWSDEEMDQLWRNLVASIRMHGPISQSCSCYMKAILPPAPEALMDVDPRARSRLRLDIEEARRQYREFGEWYEYVFVPMVPIAQIELTPVWNRLRYEDNKKRLSDTGKMPPVFLHFNDTTQIYMVEDGMHRIHAAKDLGYTHVPAVASHRRTYPPG